MSHNVIRLEDDGREHTKVINIQGGYHHMARRSNKLVVPECANALKQMKYEVASELGVPIGAQGGSGADTEFAGELGSIGSMNSGQQYLGNLTSREAGSIGGGITKRLVRQAQQTVI
jgi:hypothetical protein